MIDYEYIDISLLILIFIFTGFFLFKWFFEMKPDINYFNKNRKINILVYSSTCVYILLLFLLSRVWYGPQSTVKFHFFNDWPEWNYLDKLGHFFTAFHISDIAIRIINWAGLNKNKALILGMLAGIIFQTPIEIMDGFGIAYGFSWGDMVANIAGGFFVIAQYWFWNEIRIFPKFSFQFTPYAALRPEMLGHNSGQQFLKDYNGQTYWFAIDYFSFFKNIKVPGLIKALCFSFGYGAEGMVHGRESENNKDGFFPFQQYYLSPEINFEKISTSNKFLQIFFFAINKLHAIMPAIEYSGMHGLKWHTLYF